MVPPVNTGEAGAVPDTRSFGIADLHSPGEKASFVSLFRCKSRSSFPSAITLLARARGESLATVMPDGPDWRPRSSAGVGEARVGIRRGLSLNEDAGRKQLVVA